MADTAQPIPVILCGARAEIGGRVTATIKPEIEVIQFIASVKDAKENFASLLAGNGPKTQISNDVGSHNFSRPPRAIIFGRGYTDEEVRELNRLFRGSASQPVAWIAGDPSIAPPTNPGPAYALKAAENVKRTLFSWIEAGGESEEVVYYY
ncbi:hypothetical protein GGS20DRAFT_586696 [Poronia punctata]|nr:hypothetical protein GGS20DRAFT_586696 [Poronia punctata]